MRVMLRATPMMDYRIQCLNISIPRIPHHDPQHSRPPALYDTPFPTHPFIFRPLPLCFSPSSLPLTHPSPQLSTPMPFSPSLPLSLSLSISSPSLPLPSPDTHTLPLSSTSFPPSPARVWGPNLPLVLWIYCSCIPMGRRLYGMGGIALFSSL